MKPFQIVAILIAAFLALPAFAQSKPTTSDMQILTQKIKADKKLVVAANMELTEGEAKGFWPVYEAYQKDLAAINERTAKAVVSYADAYNKGPVPDATAKKLLAEYLAIEGAEVKLKQDYVPKLEKVIPAMKVVRYMQIESKIRAIVKYELAASIPLV